jgi:hypothetical protein
MAMDQQFAPHSAKGLTRDDPKQAPQGWAAVGTRGASIAKTNFNQARCERAARLSGVAGAFGEAADLAPQVLELQQALLAGMVLSQRREAERLAAQYDKEDPRIARAVDRMQSLQALNSERTGQAAQVANFVATFQHDCRFSGYVSQADGTPAEGYTVRVEVLDVANKGALRGSAKTDATGYFQIDLSGTDQVVTREGAGLRQFVEHLVSALPADADAPDDGSDEARAPAAAKCAAPAAEATVTSRAEVLDDSGRVVFEDPIPPTCDVVASEFRW